MCVFVVGSLALRKGTHTGDGPVQGGANETTSRTLQHRDYADVEGRAEDRLVAAALRRLAGAGSAAEVAPVPLSGDDGRGDSPLARLPAATADFWRSLMAAYPDWDVEVMRRIIDCESHGDENAVSPDGRNWGGMQINVVNYPGDPYDLLMPVVNVAVGHDVWLRQGYTAWACY